MGYTAIIDYGVGNLASITHALEYLGEKTLITADRAEIERADSIILPGVGAFPDAYAQLCARGFPELLRAQSAKKPMLGICLGMQLLFDSSDEVRSCRGLGLIPGRVGLIRTDRKLPHIGWNSLRFKTPSPLFRGVAEGSYVYFVHSYCGYAENADDVSAVTDYGTEVVAAVGRGFVYGTQFHPEKSGDVGLAILKNFVEISK
jgi:glutamine amidotransferase